MRELRGKADDSPLVFDGGEYAFTIKGRGIAFAHPHSRWKLPEGMWEPWDMTGHPAIVNGVEVKISGVEAFCSARGPGHPYIHSFCLLLNEEDAKKLGWSGKGG